MLELTSFSASIAGKDVLAGVNRCFSPGVIYGLVAPNGFGKTTFLKGVAGIGGIAVQGNVVAGGAAQSRESAFRGLVHYVPGDASSLYRAWTVWEHLRAVRVCWGATTDLNELADRCNIRSFCHKRVQFLSMGMKQQVALAMGYLTGARYLLLDEPMNALDPSNQKRNQSIIRMLAENGVCIIMSSHILSNIDEMCENIIYIDKKKLIVDTSSRGSSDMYAKLYL